MTIIVLTLLLAAADPVRDRLPARSSSASPPISPVPTLS